MAEQKTNPFSLYEVLLHPREELQKALPRATAEAAIKRFAIHGVIIGVIAGLLPAVLTFGISLVLFPILFVIGLLAYYLPTAFLDWSIAKLLGGKGAYTGNIFLASQFVMPLYSVSLILFIVLVILPPLGVIAFAVLGLYMAYLSIVQVSVANQMGMGKSVLVKVIQLVLAVLVLLALGSLIQIPALPATPLINQP
ncbi:MAG: hypothetical protein V1776_01330 [Candidatus Diapherotrites archaeon]